VKARDPGARLTYIYTGGSWVHSRGTGGLETWTDERQPHSGQNKLTAWRWEVEKEVLSSTSSQDPNSRADESGDEVNGIVVRPPVLYGRSGSLLKGLVFQPALEAAKKGESFETFANPDTRFLTIHQDDLADLFVRVAERVSRVTDRSWVTLMTSKAPICKGQAFVGANPLSERFGDVLDAVVRVSGAKGHKIRAPEQKNGVYLFRLHPFLDFLLCSFPISLADDDHSQIYSV